MIPVSPKALLSFETLAIPEPGLLPVFPGVHVREKLVARVFSPPRAPRPRTYGSPRAPEPGFLPVSPGGLVSNETILARRDRPPSPVSSIPISATQSLEAVLSELLPLQSSGEHSLRLSDIFPSLADLSFDQVVNKSTICLKAAARIIDRKPTWSSEPPPTFVRQLGNQHSPTALPCRLSDNRSIDAGRNGPLGLSCRWIRRRMPRHLQPF